MKKTHYVKKIRKDFPNIQFKKTDIVTHGWDDDVILLDKKIVFVFPKTKPESVAKLNKELRILPKLNKHVSLSIPNFIYIPPDKSFAGYKYINGEPLTTKIFLSLTDKQQNLITAQIAKFLSELHTFPKAIAKRNGIDLAWSENDARNYYEKQVKAVYKKLNKNDRTILQKLFLATAKTVGLRHKKALVHQDFTNDHIIFDKKLKKISGVIDFGDIQISDPAIDFAGLWEYGEKFVGKVIKKYQVYDPTLNERSWGWHVYHCIGLMYCGITMQRKDYWETGYRIIANYY